MYTIRIFDHDLTLLRSHDQAASLSFRKRKNESGYGDFALPYDEEAASDLELAANVSIYRRGEGVFQGRIVRRDASRNEIQVQLIGHADRLTKFRTPHNWEGWNGHDLADLARNVLRRFVFRRFATKSEWADSQVLYQVDVDEEPGSVMLARVPHLGGEKFVSEGYVVLRLDLGEQALPTGRILRWVERAGEPTRITIQSRTADTEEGLASAPWTQETTAVNAGAIRNNETVGVPLMDGGRWVEVRIWLRTEDTESPDNEQDPAFYGRTPIIDAAEIIWREPIGIEEGSIPAQTGYVVQDGSWNRVSLFKALKDECDEAGFEFQVRHDEVSGKMLLDLARTFGIDRSDTMILRTGHNVRVTRLSDSDEQYANVLNCFGAGSGLDVPYVQVRDEQAIEDRKEIVEADITFDTDDVEELHDLGVEELAKRVQATSEYRVQGQLDAYVTVGDKVRVIDPRTRTVAVVEVTDEEWHYTPSNETATLALGGANLFSAIERLTRAQRTRPRGTIGRSPKRPVNLTPRGYATGIVWRWTGLADMWEIEHTQEEDEAGHPINWAKLATVVEPYYDHQDLETLSVHWYRFRSIMNGRSSAWVEARAVAVDRTPPGKPLDPTVVTGPGKVARLSWTEPEDSDVYEYEVWRAEGNTLGDPEPTATAVWIADEKGNVHIDTTGEVGKGYTWFVRAIDYSENASAFSDGVYAVVPPVEADTTAPSSLAGIAVTFNPDTVYQDSQGNSFVKVSMNLSDIPADEKRAYIQVKHRRVGSTEYRLDDQLTIASGAETVTVDDLVPNIGYEFAFVPVSHFGIQGTGKVQSHTTSKDSIAPATPTNVQAVSGFRSVGMTGAHNTEPDFLRYELHVSTEQNFDPRGWDGSKWSSEPNDPDEWDGATNTLAAIGHQLPIEVTGFTPGETFYMRLVAVDTSINRSAPSSEVNAVADKTISRDYAEIRNVLPYTYLESIDSSHPVIYDFYIPSETTKIVKVLLSAKGVPFRAYATGAAGGDHTHTVDIPAHTHSMTFTKWDADTTPKSLFTSGGGHSHPIVGDTGSDGEHDHGGRTIEDTHSHGAGSLETDYESDHVHDSGTYSTDWETVYGTSGSAGGHSHSISGTTQSSTHAHDIDSDGNHSHDAGTLATPSDSGTHNHTIEAHTHSYFYYLATATESGGAGVYTSSSGPHTHELVFGIHEDTTPTGVGLYCDDGNGFPVLPDITLPNAPDSSTPYNLATELDLTQYFTSPGWKAVKFTSTRLGRINAQIIVKVDLTA